MAAPSSALSRRRAERRAITSANRPSLQSRPFLAPIAASLAAVGRSTTERRRARCQLGEPCAALPARSIANTPFSQPPRARRVGEAKAGKAKAALDRGVFGVQSLESARGLTIVRGLCQRLGVLSQVAPIKPASTGACAPLPPPARTTRMIRAPRCPAAAAFGVGCLLSQFSLTDRARSPIARRRQRLPRCCTARWPFRHNSTNPNPPDGSAPPLHRSSGCCDSGAAWPALCSHCQLLRLLAGLRLLPRLWQQR